jgi:hypothetical protein
MYFAAPLLKFRPFIFCHIAFGGPPHVILDPGAYSDISEFNKT